MVIEIILINLFLTKLQVINKNDWILKLALKNTIRRRLNTASNPGTNGPKRAQAFGIKGPNLPNGQIQTSGIKGNHSDHIYFVNLFPRMKLNHSTA